MKRKTEDYKTITYSKIIHDTGRAVLIYSTEKGTCWIPKLPAIFHPLNFEVMVPYSLYYKLKWKGNQQKVNHTKENKNYVTE